MTPLVHRTPQDFRDLGLVNIFEFSIPDFIQSAPPGLQRIVLGRIMPEVNSSLAIPHMSTPGTFRIAFAAKFYAFAAVCFRQLIGFFRCFPDYFGSHWGCLLSRKIGSREFSEKKDGSRIISPCSRLLGLITAKVYHFFPDKQTRAKDGELVSTVGDAGNPFKWRGMLRGFGSRNFSTVTIVLLACAYPQIFTTVIKPVVVGMVNQHVIRRGEYEPVHSLNRDGVCVPVLIEPPFLFSDTFGVFGTDETFQFGICERNFDMFHISRVYKPTLRSTV